MPDLIRLYLRSVAIGFAVAAGFTLSLLWLDVAGVGALVRNSDMGWIAAFMLAFFNGILFAAVQFGFSVMALTDDGAPGGGHGARTPAPVPVPVAASAAGVGSRKDLRG